MPSHSEDFLAETARICAALDTAKIEALADELVALRERGGRLFILGVGGSAANASHATNDFRKLCNIEAYCPTDNVAELTARCNDEGWNTVFSNWLEASRLCWRDAILILSVGGGDEERQVSVNLVYAVQAAKACDAMVLGIVGSRKGYTAREGETVVIVPKVNRKRVTPHSESFQAVIWHCLVSHPKLQQKATKW